MRFLYAYPLPAYVEIAQSLPDLRATLLSSLLADQRGFRCRLCLNLTYRSRQEHNKRLDRFKHDPEALGKLLRVRGPIRSEPQRRSCC